MSSPAPPGCTERIQGEEMLRVMSSSIPPFPCCPHPSLEQNLWILLPTRNRVHLVLQGQHPGHHSLLSGQLLHALNSSPCIHSCPPSFIPSRGTQCEAEGASGPSPTWTPFPASTRALHFCTCHFVCYFLNKFAQII